LEDSYVFFLFLGQNLRKYNNKLIIQPSKDNTKSFQEKIRGIIRKARGWGVERLIRMLIPVPRGWANYHRNIQAYRTFSKIHHVIQGALFKWAKRRNSSKTPRWMLNRFFRLSAKRRFSCMIKDKQERPKLLELLMPIDIPLVRYIKISGESNPF